MVHNKIQLANLLKPKLMKKVFKNFNLDIGYESIRKTFPVKCQSGAREPSEKMLQLMLPLCLNGTYHK